MSVSLMHVLAELTIAASLAIVVVAILRKPLRRIAGARVAYLLWLLVPTSQLAGLLPVPSQPSGIVGQALPQSVFSAIPDAVSSWSSAIPSVDLATIGMIVWASGSLLMLAIVIRRQRVFVRSLGKIVAARDGTHRSSAIRSPLLVGLWRSTVVLPADFEARYR